MSYVTYKEITSSTNAVLTGRNKLAYVVLTAGNEAASAILYDSLTQTGDKVVTIKTEAGKTQSCSVEVLLKNGLSVTLSGSGALLYIYFE